MDGNITGSQAISVLGQLNDAVYASTPAVASEPFACNLNGLSRLQCGSDDGTVKKASLTTDGATPIRAVTAAGLFAPAPWMVEQEWQASKAGTKFYQQQDFDDMVAAGVNTVVLPVPLSVFDIGGSSSKKKYSDKSTDELDDILAMVHKTRSLKAIVQLIGVDKVAHSVPSAVKSAIQHVSQHVKHPETVLAVELPDIKYIHEARLVDGKLPLFVPVNLSQVQHLGTQAPELEQDPHVYGVLNLAHTSTVADIASSTSLDDRSKLFYHENVACMQRSPVEYMACFQHIPVLVSGFDLSIDNCALEGRGDVFVNYGQCGRFDETVHSDWWHRHRRSFGTRQLFAYEQGLGWTYPAWKLWDHHGSSLDYDTIDSPAKLLSLKAILKAGLLPDLTSDSLSDDMAMACLNPPETDFVLGDATLAPTPGPPPDCWPGWWNATIDDCSYWVPPPTDSPVGCPICEECDESTGSVSTFMDQFIHGSNDNATEADVPVEKTVRTAAAALIRPSSPYRDESPAVTTAFAFVAGAVVALLVASIWSTRRRRQNGYETIPSNNQDD